MSAAEFVDAAVGHTAAVDEHEGTGRAETAQVQRRLCHSEPFKTVTFWAAKACGNWFTRSSIRVTPCVTTSAAVTCVTGVVASEIRGSDARTRHDDFTPGFPARAQVPHRLPSMHP